MSIAAGLRITRDTIEKRAGKLPLLGMGVGAGVGAAGSVVSRMGEAVGKLYVSKYFPPEAKAQADLLVKNIISAMDQRLANLTWMDPKTKTEAPAKLAKFTPKIGYPNK